MPKQNTGTATNATRRNNHNFHPVTWDFTDAAGSARPLAVGAAENERRFLLFFATVNSGPGALRSALEVKRASD
jgi:hypothetical protein